MEKRRGTWMAHGTTRRVLSKQDSLQPDDIRMRDMILNLMCIVGFLFLGLILLHVFFNFANNFSFRVYVAIFLILECIVITVRLYIYLTERMRSKLPAFRDVEKSIQISAEKTPGSPSQPNFAFSSYESIATKSKEFHQKRNSL